MHNYGTSDKFLEEPLEQRHHSASSRFRNLFNDRMAIGWRISLDGEESTSRERGRNRPKPQSRLTNHQRNRQIHPLSRG
jgi:hypothetical protein